MTYTPTNWVDGSTPLNRANMMKIENELAALDSGLVAPACMLTRSAAQTIVTSTLVSITWTVEALDTDNMFTSGSVVTVRTAGLYLISVMLTWDGNAGGSIRELVVVRNGARIVDQSVPPAANAQYQTNTSIYPLAVNDVLEVQVFQNTGASIGVAQGSAWPWFQMVRLSA